MKKLYWWLSIGGFVFIIVLWVLAYHFAELKIDSEWICRGEEKHGIQRLNAVYVSLGALFTALAFGGALLSIIYQRKTTLRATSLEVFTRVYSTMQSQPLFIAALRYIIDSYSHSNEHSKSIEEIKNDKIPWYDDDKLRETSKYKAIVYFCEKMDYIGLLVKQDYIGIVLLYPTGGLYVKAFNTLSKHFFTDKDRKRYIHFRYLIYRMQKEDRKYNNYIDHMDNKIAKFERQRMKFSFLQKWISRSLKQSCDKCKHYEENM